VTRHDKRNLQARKASAPSRIPAARLDALIEEAIVDAYTEAEQAVGFHATIEQHVAIPFDTVVLGTTVTVRKIDVTAAGGLIAICYIGRARQAIPILELRLPNPPPAGWEWIEAYRRWARGRW
jgi:Calcium binding